MKSKPVILTTAEVFDLINRIGESLSDYISGSNVRRFDLLKEIQKTLSEAYSLREIRLNQIAKRQHRRLVAEDILHDPAKRLAVINAVTELVHRIDTQVRNESE